MFNELSSCSMMDYEKLCEMYTVNREYVDMEIYNELKQKKLVQIKKHPNLPLNLLNYTPITQMKKKWDKDLLCARGLVVNDEGKIIARPLPKFFNDYEVKGVLPSQPFEVYKKLDGSLIIMSFYEGKPFFCTRGSFTSEQAVQAEKLYFAKYHSVKVDPNYTYCFEIIYPNNKIIVDYKTEDDIFLLAKIHTATGYETSIENCGFRCANVYNENKTLCELKQMDTENEEGFVIRFPHNNFRVKIKFKTYINLHKAGKYTRKDVIKSLAKRENISIENIPDECFPDLKDMCTDIIQQFNNIKNDLLKEYDNIVHEHLQEKDIIEQIKQSANKQILFCLFRGQNFDNQVWRMLQK